VRYERLALEADGLSIGLDFHPRLTVFTGIGRPERAALAAELLDALRHNRPGVHLEIVDDAGHHLAIFRPEGGKARVIDVDQATDRTAEFLDERGEIDLLGATGLDLAATRGKLLLRPADVHAAQHGDEVVGRLAAADQSQLWVAAERLLRAERTLDAESRAAGASAADAALIDRIEERHRELEAAVERHDTLRKLAMGICAVTLIVGMTAVANGNLVLALLMLLAACGSMFGVLRARKRVDEAEGAAEAALADAGVSSYLGFQVQRVEGMLTGEDNRRHLLELAADVRTATDEWEALAGDVTPLWALDHYEAIAAAASARREIDLRAKASYAVDLADLRDAADPARVLVDRISELARLGGGTESFPLILDDPFRSIDPAARPAVLELLSHAASSVQIIYLTDDEEVASWARLEALAGNLSLVEHGVGNTPERLARPS
jgi:hypothetical protein